jgi:hypothetical protein
MPFVADQSLILGDLPQRRDETEDLDVPRLMHDYEASKATIVGEFVGFRLEVRLDAETGRITCVPSRRIPRDVDQILCVPSQEVAFA